MKEVLIFVAGATPQVITETIYALATSSPPVCPDTVVVITTVAGRTRVVQSLIAEGRLARLCKDYAIPSFPFDEQSIHVPLGADGQEINDIRISDDNAAMGDLITSTVRRAAADRNSRLHCSIAGGRKTMSFYLGAALQLFGRPWDRLYHVLVTPAFESHPEFFYKPPGNVTLACRDAEGSIRKISTDIAEIELAELPFIRLGEKLQLTGTRVADLVSTGQREIDIATLQPTLVINRARHTLQIGDHTIYFLPVHLMLYIAFLRQKTEHCSYPDRSYCLECTACFRTVPDLSAPEVLLSMAKDYHIICDDSKALELARKQKDGMKQSMIRQYITRINRTIAEELTDEALHHFLKVKTERQYGSSRYGVRLEKSKIIIQ